MFRKNITKHQKFDADEWKIFNSAYVNKNRKKVSRPELILKRKEYFIFVLYFFNTFFLAKGN